MQDVKGVFGGPLLGLFFVVAPGRLKNRLPDPDTDPETFPMLGTFDLQDPVFRSVSEIPLGDLLEQGLEIIGCHRIGERVDFGPEMLFDKFSGRSEPAVQINRGDERFDHIGEHRRGNPGVAADPFSDEEAFVELQFFSDRLTGDAADDRRFDLGHSPFADFRKLVKESLANHETEHGIAEKFQSFVRGQRRVGPGRVRQRFLEQGRIFKPVSDIFLALFKDGFLIRHDRREENGRGTSKNRIGQYTAFLIFQKGEGWFWGPAGAVAEKSNTANSSPKR